MKRLLWWTVNAGQEPEGWRRYVGNGLAVVVGGLGLVLGFAALVVLILLTVVILKP